MPLSLSSGETVSVQKPARLLHYMYRTEATAGRPLIFVGGYLQWFLFDTYSGVVELDK